MGEALLNGRLYLNQLFGVSSPSDAIDFAAWCNLMGESHDGGLYWNPVSI